MAEENPWGAPRIHGELLRLGFGVPERCVSRYLRSLPRNPRAGQTWKTFLRNHRDGIAAMDFFTVPAALFRVIHVFVVSSATTAARCRPLRRYDEPHRGLADEIRDLDALLATITVHGDRLRKELLVMSAPRPLDSPPRRLHREILRRSTRSHDHQSRARSG